MAENPIRRILEMDVFFISLVNGAANKKSIIWKSEVNPKEFNQDKHIEKQIKIVKSDDEKHLVYGIVYSPDEVDAHGDTASAEVIENMAYNFMRNSRTANVDRQHDYDGDEGFIAESWIVREGDPLFSDEKVGSWVVAIKVENETTWSAVKEGRIDGISMAGYADTENLEDNQEKSMLKKIWEAVSPTEKSGKVLSAKNIKKINEVIDILNDLKELGENKMEDKVENEEVETEEIEVESTEETEEIESTETEEIEIEIESEEVTELKEQLKEQNKTMEKLAKRLESLENSGNGLQSQEGQETNKSKEWYSSIQFVPPQFK